MSFASAIASTVHRAASALERRSQLHRDRMTLSRMSDNDLKDIGIHREDIFRLQARPADWSHL